MHLGTGPCRDQCSGRMIPRAETVLVETVQCSGGDRAQVERGGAEPTDVTDLRQQLDQQGSLLRATRRRVGEPGAHQGLRQTGGAGDRTEDPGPGVAVPTRGVLGRDLRGATDTRGEHPVAGDVGHRPRHRHAVDRRRDAHRTGGDAVDEVHGAVDRVDDPGHRVLPEHSAVLLPQDRVPRGPVGEKPPDQFLTGPVDGGDRVDVRALRRGDGHPTIGTDDAAPCLTDMVGSRRSDRDCQLTQVLRGTVTENGDDVRTGDLRIVGGEQDMGRRILWGRHAPHGASPHPRRHRIRRLRLR